MHDKPDNLETSGTVDDQDNDQTQADASAEQPRNRDGDTDSAARTQSVDQARSDAPDATNDTGAPGNEEIKHDSATVTHNRAPRDDMPDLSRFDGFEHREVVKESDSFRYSTATIDGERYVTRTDLDSGAVTVNRLGAAEEVSLQEIRHVPTSGASASVESAAEGIDIIERSTGYQHWDIENCAVTDCRHDVTGMSAELNKYLAGASKAVIALALFEALAATNAGATIIGFFGQGTVLKVLRAALSGAATQFLAGNTVSLGGCDYDIFGVQMGYFGVGFGPWKPKCHALVPYTSAPGHLSYGC